MGQKTLSGGLKHVEDIGVGQGYDHGQLQEPIKWRGKMF